MSAIDMFNMSQEPYRPSWELSQFSPLKPTPNLDELLEVIRRTPPPISQAPSIQSPPVQEKSLIDKIADATRAVRKTIADGKLNKSFQVQWVERVRIALRPLYGKQAPLLATLDQWRKEILKTPLPTDEFIFRVEQVEHLLRSFNAPAASGSLVITSRPSLAPATKNVFIVHGHDELNLRRLSQLISDDFKLAPIVLLDKPGRSAPTIDKFEQHAETCSYAVSLFTADDKVVTKTGTEYWQPRPNVIFETGWFVGRLGKERVLILFQEGVKIYSDFDGVNRIQFQSDVQDKFRGIQAELEAARLI
jgi:hypothetical protein